MMKFDDIIKEKLGGFEAPADSPAWSKLDQALNSSKTPFNGPLAAGIAATVVMTILFTSMPDITPQMDEVDASPGMTVTPTHIVNDAVVNDSDDGHVPQSVHKIALEPRVEVGVGVATPKTLASDQSNPEINSDNNDAHTKQTSQKQIGSDVASNDNGTSDFIAKGIQCVNSDVLFTAQLDSRAEVTWLIEDIHVYEGLTAQHTFENSGDQIVRMAVKFEDGSETAVERIIQIYESPEANMDVAESDQTRCFKSEVTLEGTPGSNTYKWLLDGDTVGKGQTYALALDQGLHTLGMHIINKEGCTSFEQESFTVEGGFTPFYPNSFSPNGDGVNDIFEIVGLENARSYKIEIIRASTRQLAFSSTDKTSWDGSINGTAERAKSEEVFLLKLQVVDECGEHKEFNTPITYL